MNYDPAEAVKQVIREKVRPVLRAHGGDLEFIKITDDNRLVIKLSGACSGCPASRITLEETVEVLLREVWPELQGIDVDESVDKGLLEQAKAILAKKA
jgi:Fe-S cluster biogenesis protein NfuA